MTIHLSNELRTNPDRKHSVCTNRYIAFHKGRLLPDATLALIIDAALRGKMTPSGAQLLLIPDTRQGPADSSGLRQIGKFQKADCLSLKQLLRKITKSSTLPNSAKKAKNGLQNIKQINALKTRKMQKTRTSTTVSDSRFLHQERA